MEDDKQKVFTIRHGIQTTAEALYSAHSWSSNSMRWQKVKAHKKSMQSQAGVKSDALRMYNQFLPSVTYPTVHLPSVKWINSGVALHRTSV